MEEIPMLGFGTFNVEPEKCKKIVRYAIECGYRHIDTASIYRNEESIGDVIKEKIEKGYIKRNELFITTKVWCTYAREEQVLKSIKESLKKLKLEYVDLLLIHWPIGFIQKDGLEPEKDNTGEVLIDNNVSIEDTWRGMEKVYNEKLAKRIGVSNFNEKHIKRILDICTIRPFANQIEIHPYLPQFELVNYCQKNNIHVTAYSPFGSGKEPNILEDKTLKKIADTISTSTSQLIISWIVKRNISVIPRTTKENHASANKTLVELTDEHMNMISNISKHISNRYIAPEFATSIFC